MENAAQFRNPSQRPTVAVAAWPHTIVVVLAILAVTASGLWSAHTSAPATIAERHVITQMYLPALIYEWALLAFVWLGVRRTTGLRGLVGGRWVTARDVVADFSLGLGFWCAWYVIERFVEYLLGPSHPLNIDYFFPRGISETLLWIAMALTSGFCEEVVFRGYLLKQFSAWTRNPAIGLASQAVLFGAAHPLLGFRQMIVICISGALFGGFALWRDSLRPGMVAHAWADIFGGILVKGLPYK